MLSERESEIKNTLESLASDSRDPNIRIISLSRVSQLTSGYFIKLVIVDVRAEQLTVSVFEKGDDLNLEDIQSKIRRKNVSGFLFYRRSPMVTKVNLLP